MPRQIVRRKISSLRRGPNARLDLGPEPEARADWRSYKKGPIHPFLIKLPDLIVDGNRRHWGAELEDDLEQEVDCLVFEGDATPDNIAKAQFACAVHRADISLHDKCVFMIGFRDASPGRTLKELAAELEIDPTMPTKLLMFEKCIPEVREHIKAGRVGLRDMVSIAALSPEEQPVLLAVRLGGGSVQEVERQSRKRKSGASEHAEPPPKTAKVKIPLATDAATGQVTVAAAPGEEIDLEATETLLKEALRFVRAAKDKALSVKSAQGVWADMAAAN